MADMHNHVPSRLHLVVDTEHLHNLFLIMQTGFMIRTQVGCTLRTFLTGELGLSPDFIEERIQTIFLDGQPVDDVDTAIVKDGSSLALSSAMPGLVGAAMRRGGFYGRLRSSITYQETEAAGSQSQGTVRMKLYNLLMAELGELFLHRGISVATSFLYDFLTTQPDSFWTGCSLIVLDDRNITKEALLRPQNRPHAEQTFLLVTG